MNLKISVITIAYNCEKFIAESIESILSQTFSDFEFIIINDGSTDGTADIIRSYKDRRIRYFNNTFNMKTPRRRNEAIKLAKTPFIAIQDGSDISLPERLSESFRVLYNHLEVFCVGSQAIKIDFEGKEIEKITYPPETNDECFNMVKKKCKNPMIDPSTMFRKDIFLEIGGYTLDKSLSTVFDFDLWTKAMAKKHEFINFPSPLIKYRDREQLEKTTNKNKMDIVRAQMAVLKKHMSNHS